MFVSLTLKMQKRVSKVLLGVAACVSVLTTFVTLLADLLEIVKQCVTLKQRFVDGVTRHTALLVKDLKMFLQKVNGSCDRLNARRTIVVV